MDLLVIIPAYSKVAGIGAVLAGIQFSGPLGKHVTSKLPRAVTKALSICSNCSGDSWRPQGRCPNGSD